jgi:uncharacterized protein (TIGR03083 family)
MDAARRERAEILTLCHDLDDSEWQSPSAAAGWRVQDVVAHLGSSCRALFNADVVKILRSKQIERTNDDLVDERRSWTPAQTLTEYERWSARGMRVFDLASRTPLAGLPLRIGELGRYPVAQMVGAMVFDTHVHLRHDIIPVLGRQAPATDDNRMAVVVDWMMAVLSNQMAFERPDWRDRAITITLTGLGGGSWTLGADGTLRPGRDSSVAAEVAGVATEFPEWGTKRAEWRDRDVAISGDNDYGVRFLDAMNIV